MAAEYKKRPKPVLCVTRGVIPPRVRSNNAWENRSCRLLQFGAGLGHFLESTPSTLAMSPGRTGFPASFMALRTCSSMVNSFLRTSFACSGAVCSGSAARRFAGRLKYTGASRAACILSSEERQALLRIIPDKIRIIFLCHENVLRFCACGRAGGLRFFPAVPLPGGRLPSFPEGPGPRTFSGWRSRPVCVGPFPSRPW